MHPAAFAQAPRRHPRFVSITLPLHTHRPLLRPNRLRNAICRKSISRQIDLPGAISLTPFSLAKNAAFHAQTRDLGRISLPPLHGRATGCPSPVTTTSSLTGDAAPPRWEKATGSPGDLLEPWEKSPRFCRAGSPGALAHQPSSARSRHGDLAPSRS